MTAFEEFYASEFPLVYRACVAFVRDREIAVDAAQEAFSRAFARWRRLRDSPWAGGWVMTTALNICKRSVSARHQGVIRRDSPHPSTIDAADSRIDLLTALRRLPSRQPTTAVLHYLGDLPISVIADLIGVTEGAVKSHLFHARQALRRELDPEREDHGAAEKHHSEARHERR